MTQEEKAKAYDEALERARKIHNQTEFDYEKGMMEKIFPELQENEDEMTLKDIEKNIENIVNDKKYAPDAKDFIIKELKEQIACFKKQGEQKNINPTLLEKEKMDNAFTQMIFKGKTALEAKFHKGDWIANNNSGAVCQVIEIRDDEYCLWPLDAEMMGYLRIIDVDNDYHLWTIEDAKEGDILVNKAYDAVLIFKSIRNNYLFSSYCDYFVNTFKAKQFSQWASSAFIPATKKQRDFLFEKMREAGYEWDTEKKKLRKIIQNPTDKVYSKFQEGNWIVNSNTKDVFLIKSINNGYCTLEDIKGNIISPCLPPCESESHIWTIKDAKEGDVLTSKDGVDILIFRNFDTNTSFSSYYNIEGRGELGWSNKNFIPANKEQCDLLFSKIKEAGYEWDAEKKELRKFEKQDEQKPADVLREKPNHHEGWANVYKCSVTGKYMVGDIFDSDEQAKPNIHSDEYIATVKIEWDEQQR